MIVYVEEYIDDDGLLDANLLPEPLKTSYKELRHGRKPGYVYLLMWEVSCEAHKGAFEQWMETATESEDPKMNEDREWQKSIRLTVNGMGEKCIKTNPVSIAPFVGVLQHMECKIQEHFREERSVSFSFEVPTFGDVPDLFITTPFCIKMPISQVSSFALDLLNWKPFGR
ncbi:hypothetical protein CLAIMM_10646 [Cladophialophora immunda]|nr:hypothetical protein CLAIMM_10646 [Cladophialophora immunda]